MGLLTPTRRVYHRWRNVLPLYDGRECPDCAAVVCGREARRVHREWHMAAEQWQEWAQSTLLQVARYAGMTVPELAPQGQGDDGGRVDLRAEQASAYDEEDEEDDE